MRIRKISVLLNELISAFFVWRIRRAYYSRIIKVVGKSNAQNQRINPIRSKEYQEYWSRFGWKVDPIWYRHYLMLSGVDILDYVPSDVFYAVIERRLNDPNETFHWANKNFLEKNYGSEFFPETVIRYHSNALYDDSYNPISIAQAQEILEGVESDLVFKLSEESCGGHGVRFYAKKGVSFLDSENRELDLQNLIKNGTSFLIQKAITQSAFTASFNPSSVNTFRVVVLRRPSNEEWVVLRRILRMGVGNVRVDNQSSGGISVGLLNDGRMHEHAFDGEGKAFSQHPSTGVQFRSKVFEESRALNEFALRVASGVPSLRMLSLDIVQCEDGSFKCLEVNTYGMQIDFLQTYDGGMFGEFTDEVVDFCLANKNLFSYKHIRGFYY